MSIAGYHFYLNGQKVNDVPNVSPTYTFTGLASDSGYSLTATAVDAAGNESALSEVLSAATTAIPLGEQPITSEQAAAIDAIIAASMGVDKQPGVLVDITGPAGVYRKAYGSTGSRPVTIDDHFRMGSITKTFVAMAVFQQVDQNRALSR